MQIWNPIIMAMNAKDLRTEAVLGDRSNDGNAKYVQDGTSLPCKRTKPYQDIGSNLLAKVDVQTARPCAVIGPDRIVPPAASGDAYLKKGPAEQWLAPENIYRRPSDYPHKTLDYQHPARNISPRQTFQENMQRIMVPPSYNSVKLKEDHNVSVDTNISPLKNNKFSLTPDKYCEVPYPVNNAMTNDPKTLRNSDISVTNVNPHARGLPHTWPSNSANIRPAKPYGAPELYQYPDYSSCAGPRPMLVPRPHRAMHEEGGHMYPDAYYQEGSVRFKPYPSVKERFVQPRYDYIGNYSNPYHPAAPFPPAKFEMQKPILPHPYPTYPQVPIKYLDSRIAEPIMPNSYHRPNQPGHFGNIPYRNQVIHPTYGPIPGNCIQTSKYFPFTPENSGKPINSNKLPYDPSNKIFTESFYVNDIGRPHPMKSNVLPPNYPANVYNMPTHSYYRRENIPIKSYEYGPHPRSIDPSMTVGGRTMGGFCTQFSPAAIAISPSDSNTSNETNQTQGTSHDDYGYVSQSSSASVRSMDSGINRIPLDFYRRYDPRYNAVKSSLMPKCDGNFTSGSKDKKDIDVRQFLQMWNEGEDENGDNINTQESGNMITQKKDMGSTYESNNQEQLYVLGLVNVPSEELSKYEHIQKVSKLPENIKGYNSIELLHQFEEVIESSNLNNYNSKPPTPRAFDTSVRGPTLTSLHGLGIPTRPISPLDFEAKISQSVIHKEVGCNFEIKPCSPKMMNVEIAAPVQNLLAERVIEKVANPLIIHSPVLNNSAENILTSQDKNITENVSSCKMINTQFSHNDNNEPGKANYSLHDLESNSGVCLASLPRLDNDIELNFPEVNQQFINANKVETVITATAKDLPNLDLDPPGIKEQVVLEIDQCQDASDFDKDLSKLSKYRKLKRKRSYSIELVSDHNIQAMRTDSVIIKNPENLKNQECIENSLKISVENAQHDPINLKVTTDSCITELDKDTNKHEISTLNHSDEFAIDFSLNSTVQFNTKDDSHFGNTNEDAISNDDSKNRPPSTNSEAELSKSACQGSNSEVVNHNDNISNDQCNKTKLKIKSSQETNESDVLSNNERNNLEPLKNVTSPLPEVTCNLEKEHLNESENKLCKDSRADNKRDVENNAEFSFVCSGSSLSIENMKCSDPINELPERSTYIVAVKDADTNEKSLHCSSNNIAENAVEERKKTLPAKSSSAKKRHKSKEKLYKSRKKRDKTKLRKTKIFKAETELQGTYKKDPAVSLRIDKNIVTQYVDDISSHHKNEQRATEDIMHNKESTSVKCEISKSETKTAIMDAVSNFEEQSMQTYVPQEKSQDIKNSTSFLSVGAVQEIESKNSIADGPGRESQKTGYSVSIANELFNVIDGDQCISKSPSMESITSNVSGSTNKSTCGPDESQDKYNLTALPIESHEITSVVSPKNGNCCNSDKLTLETTEGRTVIPGIDSYVSEESSEFDEAREQFIENRNTLNGNETFAQSSTHKKELFSPQIQKLILKQEGLCTSKLVNIIDFNTDKIKPPSALTGLDSILQSFSEVPINSPSFEMCVNTGDGRSDSEKHFKYESIENSPVRILDSVKEDLCDIDENNYDLDQNNSSTKTSLIGAVKENGSSDDQDGFIETFDQNIYSNRLISGITLSTETISSTIENSSSMLTKSCAVNEIDTQSHSTQSDSENFASEKLNRMSPSSRPCEEGEINKIGSIFVIQNTNITEQCTDDLIGDTKHSIVASDKIEHLRNTDKSGIVDISMNSEVSRNSNDLHNNSISNTASEPEKTADDSIPQTKVDKDIISCRSSEDKNVTEISAKFAKNEDTVEENVEEVKNSDIQEFDKEFTTRGNKLETYICDNENSCLPHRSPNHVGDKSNDQTLLEEIDPVGVSDLKNDVHDECKYTFNKSITVIPQNNMLNDEGVEIDNERCSEQLTDGSQNKVDLFEVNQNDRFRYAVDYRYKKKNNLKRSLSESALDEICENSNSDNRHQLSKRLKVDDTENIDESQFFTESYCNIIQQNRRNSLSSMYTEESVSFCILIDNNCIIAEEDSDKICYAEIPAVCLRPDEENSYNIMEEVDEVVQDTEEGTIHDKFNNSPSITYLEQNKSIEDAWVDDVACVETVFCEDVANDITISASISPINESESEEEFQREDEDIYGNHTDKVKYIYGGKMCSNDAHLVDTLYRTPQKDVNKTLSSNESLIMEEFNRYYDKESLEKVLSGSNIEAIVCEKAVEIGDQDHSTSRCNEILKDFKGIFDMKNTVENNSDKRHPLRSENTTEGQTAETQVHTVYSCESSVDNVLSYSERDESPKRVISNSPEVSSTTSEEKNSGILLKITNYNGSIVSEINNINSNSKSSCKYTEDKDYVRSQNTLPARPLITKAAQKYIPPIKESIPDLKVKLPLPQHSLLKLRQLKVAKEKPHQIPKPCNPLCGQQIPKKPKPKFEDVLKSIDEIQIQKHKDSKKIKKAVPKVVIKKNENGSHYASSSNSGDRYNPDLTGRKWQPWVFIERNNFIDKMARKQKTRAIFNYRKKMFVLAEKFRKYKSINNTNFVISPPKSNDSVSGQLKYTIKLKQSY